MTKETKETKTPQGIHSGHRNRVKQEFLAGGLASFSEVRALELLLFYARPQGDVNALAHDLINAFGSLAGVLDADMQQLTRVPGVKEHTAILLKLVTAMAGKYLASRSKVEMILTDTTSIYRLFAPYFFGAKNEMIFVACLDNKLQVLGVRKLGEGIPNAADITARQVAEAVISLNATVVVLAHNHISGVAHPSQADLDTTAYLQSFLAKMSVTLYDHVIIANEDMISLRDSRYL